MRSHLEQVDILGLLTIIDFLNLVGDREQSLDEAFNFFKWLALCNLDQKTGRNRP